MREKRKKKIGEEYVWSASANTQVLRWNNESRYHRAA